MGRNDVMDTETAIKEIKDRIELEWRHRFPADLAPDYIEALKLAVEALEKQKPKKPNNDIFDEKRCPICLERAIFQTWKHGYPVKVKMKFCQNCGQKLDWED